MLVYFAFMLTVLLGFCGLAIDSGRMEWRTNQLQAAADAGAIAAANELWHCNCQNASQVQTTINSAANSDITTYETTNNIPTTGSAAPTSAVMVGPTYGSYNGDYSAVQVTITEKFPTFFLGILTKANSSVTLSVKAAAEIPPCFLFFGNPTVNNGFNGVGNNNWDYQIASAGMDTATNWGCPLYSTNGFTIDGFAHYGGSQIRTAASTSAATIAGWSSSPPIYKVPLISDPLAYIVAPTPGTCVNSAPISYLNQPSTTTINLTPGTYCGKTASYSPSPRGCANANISTTPAIDIEGTAVTPDAWGEGCPTQGGTNGNNCLTVPTVNFAPGLYVIVGGINLNCVTATGNGATLYFTNSSTVQGFGQVEIISSTWSVNAPVNASYGGIPGLNMMTDRTWVGGNQDLNIHYSTWYADGIIYSMRTGLFAYALPMSAPNYLNIVAANMYTYDAEVRPSNNYAGLPNGNPLHIGVSLVQ